MRIPLGYFQVNIGRGLVPERSGGESGKGSNVSVRERNRHAIRRGVFQAIDGIGGEAVLGLFAIRKDRKSTRLNSSHVRISYAVFCLKKKNKKKLNPT